MILYYSLPKDAQKEFKSESDSIIIGRKPLPDQSIDLDLIQDEFVSHQHSRISFEESTYWIEDMGSANGTWINDEKIQGKTLLTAADRIRIGYTEITVHIDSADEDSDFECIADMSDPTLISEAECVTAISGIDEETIIRDTANPTEVEILDEATLVSAQEKLPDYGNGYDPTVEETVVDFDADFQENGIVSNEKNSDDKPALSYSSLKAFNDFCSSMETIKGFEELADVFSQRLQFMIPNAQRGGILLSDERCELHLKAHWPAGNHSYNKIWCRKAFDSCEAFLWSDREGNIISDDSPGNSVYRNIQSAIYLPLPVRTNAMGVMYVDNDDIPGAFSLTDLQLMKAVANQVTILIRSGFKTLDRINDQGAVR